jgi:alanine dehydrogenase
MRPGAVLVDVAIDQGGCFETSHATSHEDPTFVVDGIIHYCVANMPGAVPVTSSKALTNATLPFIETLAAGGLAESSALLCGLNVHSGMITHRAVAESHGLPFVSPQNALVKGGGLKH